MTAMLVEDSKNIIFRKSLRIDVENLIAFPQLSHRHRAKLTEQHKHKETNHSGNSIFYFKLHNFNSLCNFYCLEYGKSDSDKKTKQTSNERFHR